MYQQLMLCMQLTLQCAVSAINSAQTVVQLRNCGIEYQAVGSITLVGL